MPKPSEINPKLPVWNSERKAAMVADCTPFDIIRMGTFKSPNYGPTWRVYVTLTNDRSQTGIMLFAANEVRDDAFGALRTALEENGEPIGPCMLVSVKLPNGRATFEIDDYEPVTE